MGRLAISGVYGERTGSLTVVFASDYNSRSCDVVFGENDQVLGPLGLDAPVDDVQAVRRVSRAA